MNCKISTNTYFQLLEVFPRVSHTQDDIILNDGSGKLKTGSNNAFFEVLTLIDLHFLFAR